jgi:Rrf2 family protein
MVRLGKLTDYGLVLMTCMARSHGSSLTDSITSSPHDSIASPIHGSPASALKDRGSERLGRSEPSFVRPGQRPYEQPCSSALRTARDLAAESKLPISTVSKLLKHLLQSGLLTSHRGTKGGYLLARDPHEISVLEVIAAIEGQMALTECSTDVSGLCQIETCCPIKTNQRIINQAVRGVLEKVMLSDLANPMQLTTITDAHGRLVTIASASIQ